MKRRHSNAKKNLQQSKKHKEEPSLLSSIKLHPFLRGETKKSELPLKKPLSAKSSYGVNPYYDPTSEALGVSRPKSVIDLRPSPARRDFTSEKEHLLEQALEYQKQAKMEKEEAEDWKRRRELGLIVNENLGEHKWEPQKPNWIEWWDEPLLRVHKYDKIFDSNDEFIVRNIKFAEANEEENPITIYIHHPAPTETPWGKKRAAVEQKVHLTKTEMKRLRRNTRMARREEEQDRIKLGLDPPPPPKIKMKNLMNVLTNETIKNPTALEMKVKKEMEERERLHELNNLERKATKEQRILKREKHNEADVSKMLIRGVYIIDRLVCGKNRYKVDMNAKQLDLTGTCCIDKASGKGIIIVEGGRKQTNKYKSLLMRRIDWKLNERSKDDLSEDELPDLSGNRCHLVWEGEVQERKFAKWTLYDYKSEESLLAFLDKFSMSNYYNRELLEVAPQD